MDEPKMNRDDIIRMAREAGFSEGLAEFLGLKKFARFATLVAAAEREACAKLCDELDAKTGQTMVNMLVVIQRIYEQGDKNDGH